MFDGSYKAGRQVSLRGNSKTETKEEVLARARREREERQATQQRQTSVLRLQRSICKALNTNKRFEQLRTHWDETWTATTQPLSLDALSEASILLFEFYSFQKDNSRLLALSHGLLSCSASLRSALCDSTNEQWQSRLLFMRKILLNVFLYAHKVDQSIWPHCLSLLTTFADLKDLPEASSKKAMTFFWTYLCEHGFVEACSKLLVEKTSEHRQLLFRCVILAIENSHNQQATDEFVSECLSKPDFVDQLDSDQRLAITSLTDGSQSANFSSLSSRVIATNFSYLLLDALKSNTFQVTSIVERSINSINQFLKRSAPDLSNSNDINDWENVFDHKDPLLLSIFEIVSQKNLRLLVVGLLETNDRFVCLASLCELCEYVCVINPTFQSSILSVFAFGPFIKRSWSLLCGWWLEHSNMIEIHGFVSIFCKSCLLITAVLDDDEFLSGDLCLSSSQWIELTTTLKEFVTKYLTSFIADRSRIVPRLSYGYYAIVLLNRIYERNARLRLLEDSFWLVAGLESRIKHFDPNRPNEILQLVPFFLPQSNRVSIFQKLIDQDRDEYEYGTLSVRIRRDSIFEDAFDQLSHKQAVEMRGRLYVMFINQEGFDEEGVDGGGLYKEFMHEFIKTAFDPQRALFTTTKDNLIYPNPFSNIAHPNDLELFEFIGRLLAKAMHSGVLVNLPMANFFLSKLLGKSNSFNDLKHLDSVLYKNLMTIKHHRGNVEEDFGVFFDLTFDKYGKQETVELVPGGREIAVTNDNRLSYVSKVADYYLNKQIRSQCDAFLKGFSSLIDRNWLQMFNESELQLLISGSSEIDIEDLKRNTTYHNYEPNDPIILRFWRVVSSFTIEQKKALLQFSTSRSASPLLGFAYLHPKFCISRTDAGRLPSAGTCYNMLRLPACETDEEMRKKLLQAITSGAGFEMA